LGRFGEKFFDSGFVVCFERSAHFGKSRVEREGVAAAMIPKPGARNR